MRRLRHLSAYPELIADARTLYASATLEIDDDADLSIGVDGTWVAAWVWVPDTGNGHASPEPVQTSHVTRGVR